MTKVKVFHYNCLKDVIEDVIYDIQLPVFFYDNGNVCVGLYENNNMIKQVEIRNYISNDGSYNDGWDDYILEYFERDSIPNVFIYYIKNNTISKKEFEDKLFCVLSKMIPEWFSELGGD